MSLKIIVLAKQVPDTRNVGKDAMKEDGTSRNLQPGRSERIRTSPPLERRLSGNYGNLVNNGSGACS